MDAISLLKTGFIICLSAAILFFIITVALFFIFDIKTIFMIRSGRAQAKSIKEMQNANANTGHLRSTKTSGAKTSKKHVEKPRTQEISAPTAAPLTANPYPQSSPAPEQITEELAYEDTANQTEVLAQHHPVDVTIPEPAYSETVVLSEVTDQTFEQKPAEHKAGIYFEVIKKIVCRDTEEVIR